MPIFQLSRHYFFVSSTACDFILDQSINRIPQNNATMNHISRLHGLDHTPNLSTLPIFKHFIDVEVSRIVNVFLVSPEL